MKGIKFRGMTKYADTPHFVYGLLIKEVDGEFAIQVESEHGGLSTVGVIPETVGRFTGLYDEKHKEIYEGDLVEYRADNESWEAAEVVFENGLVCFSWDFPNPLYDYENLKVVGNIHETTKKE